MERSEPHVTKLMQCGLISQGYTLPYYGADGDWGDETQKAYDAYVKDVTSEEIVPEKPTLWPTDDINDIIQFYGRPDMERGAAPQSVPLTLPYPMQLAWGGRGWITRVFLHELVRDSLERILTRILEEFGEEGIKRHGLDQYGGLTNVRMMRGSTNKISRHSFGIAIDIDPLENSFRTPWPDRATMPIAAIRCFEEEGWTSFARVRGFDAMHFQSTSNYVGN
jgi:hypothetical protein